MKFDVIIGNPPFNNSIDYKFVQMGIDLKPELMSLIHPARWKVADNIEAEQIRQEFITNKQLSNIVIYEAGHSGVTSVWPETFIQSVNYWLYNKNKNFDDIEVYTEMSNKNIVYSEKTIRKHCEKYYDYFCMNNIVLGIFRKTFEYCKNNNIKWRLDFLPKVDEQDKIYISNSLQRIYTEDNKTDDCRQININKDEVEYYKLLAQTQFWRATVRQNMSGFHSYNINAMRFIIDLDIKELKSMDKQIETVKDMEEYLEDKFNLNELEKTYLKNYGITDSP